MKSCWMDYWTGSDKNLTNMETLSKPGPPSADWFKSVFRGISMGASRKNCPASVFENV